jgi:hypothetical protein
VHHYHYFHDVLEFAKSKLLSENAPPVEQEELGRYIEAGDAEHYVFYQ